MNYQMNYQELIQDLKNQGFKIFWFNDKRKSTRRLKICSCNGSRRQLIKIHKYINDKHPELKPILQPESKMGPSSDYYTGVCVNFPLTDKTKLNIKYNNKIVKAQFTLDDIKKAIQLAREGADAVYEDFDVYHIEFSHKPQSIIEHIMLTK